MSHDRKVVTWSNLLISLLTVIVIVAVAWGSTQTKLKRACDDIKVLDKNKLEAEIFRLHSEQQSKTVVEIKESIKTQRVEQRADMKEIKDLIKAN